MKRTTALIAMLAIATLSACGSSSSSGSQPSISSNTSSAPAPVDSPTEESTPEPEQTGSVLSAQNITLAVKITSKKCFGSAGCNVEYRIKPATAVSKPFAETYEVTFTVKGDESGPIIGSFVVAEDGSIEDASDLEGYASTPRASTKITARVTSVEAA
jgi:hypothetical protein